MSLICLCASHINSIERKEYFLNMIERWFNQNHKIELHISLSATDDINILYTINNLPKYDMLYIYYQKEKLSQFNHYKCLLQSITNHDDPYVIFTNDNDLWHPDRSFYFFELITNYAQNMTYGRIPYYYENDSYIFNNNGKIICQVPNPGEYIEYICKLNIFRNFVNNATDLILNHYLADMFFLHYLRTKNKERGFILKIDDPEWMYYLRGTSKSIADKNNRNVIDSDFYKLYINIPSNLLSDPSFTYAQLNCMTLFFLCNADNDIIDKKKMLNEYFQFMREYEYNPSKYSNIIKKLFFFLLTTSYFNEIINSPLFEDKSIFIPENECKVEIRKSPVHGYGVFATTDISKGSIITYYDGSIGSNTSIVELDTFLANPNISDSEAYLVLTHLDYAVPCYENDNEICLTYLNKYPNKIQEKLMCGFKHDEIVNKNKIGSLINDAYWCNDYEDYDAKIKQISVNSYYDNDGILYLSDKRNCCFKCECIPRGMSTKLFLDQVSQFAIIATKNIKAGDEILMIYGTLYWKDHMNFRDFFGIDELYLSVVNMGMDDFVAKRGCLAQLIKSVKFYIWINV